MKTNLTLSGLVSSVPLRARRVEEEEGGGGGGGVSKIHNFTMFAGILMTFRWKVEFGKFSRQKN